MQIPANLVKELRERTGAGFSDCRAALVEAAGDVEKAINILRKKGQAAAAKKAQREASEGLVGHYIHAGGKIGVIVEVNCESDFVARTPAYQQLCHDIAMHIAALDPRYLRREEVTPEMLEKERDIYREQARATGKSEQVVEKIVTGKASRAQVIGFAFEKYHYIEAAFEHMGIAAEVVARRYKRIQEEKKKMTSLVLIDGGLGQLHAAAEALESLEIINQPLAAIAKREDCLLYTSPSPRDLSTSRMPSSA